MPDSVFSASLYYGPSEPTLDQTGVSYVYSGKSANTLNTQNNAQSNVTNTTIAQSSCQNK